jgi:glycine/D-amino acid oxidase-like deaminating enzyme/nitrite reductase/ring-hydroxylating ferredoxin subunit
MAAESDITTSFWQSDVQFPDMPALTSDASTDVCVVGGGIAGLTTAFLLQKRGKSVIVLNDRKITDSQTARTSAHLSSAIDDRFFELIKMHGEDVTRLAYQSHATAIDTIEQIAAQAHIDCDFQRVDGYLYLAEGDEPSLLDRELDACKLIGVKDVSRLDRFDAAPSFPLAPCLRFGRQAIFHPLKYLHGLVREITKAGGRIYCDTMVYDLQPDEIGRIRSISESGPSVLADAVVVATNTPAPINNWAGIYTKQSAYRTYVVGARIPKESVKNALYWDSADPYHYVRLQPHVDASHDLLIVGGEDHKVGQFPDEAAPFAALEKWARQRFPMMGEIAYRWSGQVQEPADDLAYIGKAPVEPDNLYVATGDSGMGLTHGTIAGVIITDLITKQANAFASIYDPGRKPTHAVGEFISENLNAVATFKDYLTPGEVKTEDQITPGSGAVLRSGLKKIAVYRDDAGQLHKRSAICTHLGCIVQWNHVERSWDCPCHGSRFDTEGKPIMGPAVTPLAAVKE